MIIVEHTVSHRNGAQVMVAGLKLAQLGYRRGARVILRDPTGRSENRPWEFVVANDEHATLVCRDPLPPDWIVKGVRVSIEISEPLCLDGLEPRVETNGYKADREQSAIGVNSRSLDVPELEEKHLVFIDNQKGLSFDTLLGPYLKGATNIKVTDPYIRRYYQIRNFIEFLETVVKHKTQENEVAVHLVTMEDTEDKFKSQQQQDNFEKMKQSARVIGINFTWEFSDIIHARHIITNHGWKISLDRGLDIFKKSNMKTAFAFDDRLQQFRTCRAFEMTFIKQDQENSEADSIK